jgi:uncharacterized protein (TIGR02246 family)
MALQRNPNKRAAWRTEIANRHFPPSIKMAEKARDIPAILELVADDVVFFPSSLPPVKGKDEVEKIYRAFFPRYSEIQHEALIEEVQVAGDWAFLSGIDELRLIPESGETEIHMKGKGLSILKRQPDGSWRFWRGINNMTPQPPLGPSA